MNQAQAKLDWFQTVILTQQPALRARLRRMTSSEAELDDLCSEVLTRAYATEGWERITAGHAYLYSIARNLMIDIARRGKVVAFETMADLESLQPAYDGETQLLARDELRDLQIIIDQLPPQAKRVFMLRRVYEKSPGEIAEEMRLSVSTVEKHLARAVLFVMQALAKREEIGVDGYRTRRRREEQDRGEGRAPARRTRS